MLKGPILIAEDVPNVLEFLELTLRFKGYEVVSAHNGREALALVEKTNPAMIITDILMPHMDGYTFIQKLRTSNSASSRIPVIFLSATFVTLEDKKFAMSLGATRFLEKPIDTEDFLLTIAEIWTRNPENIPNPMNMPDFYTGYVERLEEKLRYKNAQIARTLKLLPTLPDEQFLAYESMLQTAQYDRENIQIELRDVYEILKKFKTTGK